MVFHPLSTFGGSGRFLKGKGGDEDGYILGSDPDMYTARHLGRPELSGVS